MFVRDIPLLFPNLSVNVAKTVITLGVWHVLFIGGFWIWSSYFLIKKCQLIFCICLFKKKNVFHISQQWLLMWTNTLLYCAHMFRISCLSYHFTDFLCLEKCGRFERYWRQKVADCLNGHDLCELGWFAVFINILLFWNPIYFFLHFFPLMFEFSDKTPIQLPVFSHILSPKSVVSW